ncbi:MAG: hypothetical protein PCFJNLEI_02257 [Verrucomicrobiae bacterium]|nr:hypothetical protein [Verrucomicrobiae bacterium]
MRMPRRKRRGIVLPTASMGDIAFLLTIFFMVCSNFTKETGIKMELPQVPTVRQLEESAISVAIDEEGKIYLQGQEIPDAQSIELGVTALLEGRTDPTARLVMFKCDKAVDKAVFEPVLDAIGKAGATIAAVGEPSTK